MFRGKVWGVTDFDKQIVIYENNSKTGQVNVWDGIEKTEVDFAYFKTQKSFYFVSKFKFIKKDDDKTLEETRDQIIKDNDILKKETKGLINFQKQGGSVQTASFLFEHFRDKSYEPEKVDLQEGEYIRHGTYGPICFAEKYEGRGFKYDFTSHYPAIMKSQDFFIPYMKGTETTVTEPIHKIAIYRCVIEQTKDENINRLFRWNKKNLYPYDDVKRARELGLNIKFGKVWFWEKNQCVRGDKIFGQFVDYMFDLKKKKLPRAKHIFNCLAGKLMAKDILKVKIHEDEDVEAIYPDVQC